MNGSFYRSLLPAGGVWLALAHSWLAAPSVYGDDEDDQPLEEVFLTELVYPQEEGELQLTLAPEFRSGAEVDQLSSRAVVEYGLTDAWQIELEWDFFVHREMDGTSVQGLGDLEIGTKIARMEVAEDFHVAFGLEIGLPIGDPDQELGEGFIEYEPFVVVARDFPERHGLQVFARLGLGLVQRVREPEDDDEREPAAHELGLGVGIFRPTASGVATFELTYSDNTWNHGGEEKELYATPGWVWKQGPLEIGVGVSVGLNDGADDYRVLALLTMER